MMINKYLPILIIVLISSCNLANKNKIFISQDYTITIETRGCMPGESKFTAFIYNVPQYQLRDYDSYKPHHLYIKKKLSIEDSIKTEIFDLELKPQTEDSIYFYVHKYLSDFSINYKEFMINGTIHKKVISDGACLSVELEYDKKMMRCDQYNLEGIEKASKEIRQLMHIINSKVPEEFRHLLNLT